MRVLPPFEDVRRIVVLRGGGLGDLLFAVPALHALHRRYPGAELTVMSGAFGPLLRGRMPFPVHVLALPRGRGLGDGAGDPDEFVARLRAERPDLGVQLHGGGRQSNPFLLELEPRHTVGARTPDAAGLERELPYVYFQHEMIRGLEVAALAGAEPAILEPELSARPDDLAAARRVLPEPDGPLVVVHPGATDPRRRWPADRFAQVAVELAADGAEVVVIGSGDEAALAGEVCRLAASDRVGCLAGRLEPDALVGVLASAELFVGNDSGPRHLAQALGAPTASVYWFGNVVNASPLSRGRHRLQMAMRTTCPVCGRDQSQVGWTAPRCPHDDSFVAEVGVEGVLADARELMATTVRTRER